ncbi:hypothetical protein [Clostridium sp. Marseille-QA1073]
MIIKYVNILSGIIILLLGLYISKRKIVIKESSFLTFLFIYLIFQGIFKIELNNIVMFIASMILISIFYILVIIYYGKTYSFFGMSRDDVTTVLINFFTKKNFKYSITKNENKLSVDIGEKITEIELKSTSYITSINVVNVEDKEKCDEIIEELKKEFYKDKRNKFSTASAILILLGVIIISLGFFI